MASAYWTLPPGTPHSDQARLPLPHVQALLSELGTARRDAVASALLRLVGDSAAVAQCTIFAYDERLRPHEVAVGDRSRTSALPQISAQYVTRFYRLDGCRAAMAAEMPTAQRAMVDAPHIVLQRQAASDVQHADYRRICYDEPRLCERLAVLSLVDRQRWLAVNFYRGTEHGLFDAAAITAIEALTPLVVQAVRLHFTQRSSAAALSEHLIARLRERAPDLGKRDIDTLRGWLAGTATTALAEQMGITPASVQTYRKRLYRKLGVAGQRELLALLLDPTA